MLAVIAGRGHLPAIVARAAAREADVIVCHMAGFPAEGVEGFEVIAFRVERLGGLIGTLLRRGVTEVCLAGAVRRPKVNPANIDVATIPIAPRLAAAARAGDNVLLREVLAIFEERGLRVRAAHEIAPDLLPPEGVLTRRRPSTADAADADRAERVLQAMATADVGQACVVASGQVLAVEASPGTDWMLRSLCVEVPWRPGPGLLMKAPKRGQDRRVDLPAVGSATVAGIKAAGLSGLVIEAGGVMVLDRDGTVAAANADDVFVWVRPERGRP